MRLALNDIVVRKLRSDRQQTFWDASLRGFGIRVSSTGKKTWTLMVGKERRRVTLGYYPHLSLADARQKAHSYTGSVATTFAETMQSFIRLHHERKNRPATVKEKARLLTKHFLPYWSHRRLNSITKSDIQAIIDAIDKPSISIAAYAAIRTLFSWSIRRDLLQHNPAGTLLPPAKKKSRDRVLSDEELAIVWRTASDNSKGALSTIVKLLMLTGQRRSEITGLQRTWIKLDTITFPGHVCKNGREHTIPLGPEVGRIIGTLGSTTNALFPVARGGQYRAWGDPVDQFRAQCRIAHWTLHDLRRTFSTIHARIGTPPHITERILNHQVGTLTPIAKIYNRYSYIDEMRDAMFRYEQELMRIFSLPKT